MIGNGCIRDVQEHIANVVMVLDVFSISVYIFYRFQTVTLKPNF